jgi:deoxyribodipyrimidine photolyase-related protein
MSDFPTGRWCAIWDALYWRFVDRHAEFFTANPRMAMMVTLRDRLGSKLVQHRRVAEEFLLRLHDEPTRGRDAPFAPQIGPSHSPL